MIAANSLVRQKEGLMGRTKCTKLEQNFNLLDKLLYIYINIWHLLSNWHIIYIYIIFIYIGTKQKSRQQKFNLKESKSCCTSISNVKSIRLRKSLSLMLAVWKLIASESGAVITLLIFNLKLVSTKIQSPIKSELFRISTRSKRHSIPYPLLCIYT